MGSICDTPSKNKTIKQPPPQKKKKKEKRENTMCGMKLPELWRSSKITQE